MVRAREVAEGVQMQGEDEVIGYTLDVSAVGSAPSVPGVAVYDDARLDVTATVMPVNLPAVDGNVIRLSPLRNLTAGTLYRVEVRYTIDGNQVESYFYVQAQV